MTPHSESDEQKSLEMDGLLHCAVRNSSARLLLFTTKNPMRDPPRPPIFYEIIRDHEMLSPTEIDAKPFFYPASVSCSGTWGLGLVMGV
jgi:hypothetical protein